jgi:hypothetical protein
MFLSCYLYLLYIHTGRGGVTPCSALSQASCLSPDDGGRWLLPEEVGDLVSTFICEKLPALVTLLMAAEKCQEVAALHHAV